MSFLSAVAAAGRMVKTSAVLHSYKLASVSTGGATGIPTVTGVAANIGTRGALKCFGGKLAPETRSGIGKLVQELA